MPSNNSISICLSRYALKAFLCSQTTDEAYYSHPEPGPNLCSYLKRQMTVLGYSLDRKRVYSSKRLTESDRKRHYREREKKKHEVYVKKEHKTAKRS